MSLGLLGGGCLGEGSDEPEPGQAPLPFAAGNVWATPLDDDAPLDPGSGELVDTLAASVEAQVTRGRGPALSARARAPLYVVGEDAAEVPVELDSGPFADDLERELDKGVPVPPDAQPSRGSDGMMAILQPSTDSYWEFFLMEQALHPPLILGKPEVAGSGPLPPGGYSYAVTAVNGRGESRPSKTVVAQVGARGGVVRLRWSEIEGAGSYRVYRGAAGAAPGRMAAVPASEDGFTDSGERQPNATRPPVEGTARTPGQWRAAYGGMIPEVSKNPGYYVDLAHPEGGYRERYFWGASSSSLPIAAGLITRRDLVRGRIEHTLALGLPNLTPSTSIVAADRWAFPAQRTDGKSTLADAIPEGARLRLDPGLDLDSLQMRPFTRMLAEAAQRYGMIVQGGSEATVVYGEDPSPYQRAGRANFYRRYPNVREPTALRDFPWNELQVLRMKICSDPGEPCRD